MRAHPTQHSYAEASLGLPHLWLYRPGPDSCGNPRSHVGNAPGISYRLAQPPVTTEEAGLRAWLCQFSTDRTRWGCVRAATTARRASRQVNK